MNDNNCVNSQMCMIDKEKKENGKERNKAFIKCAK